MNRYGPDLKKKEKAKKKRRAASRGIPGAGRGVSYFNQEPQSRRRKRNSVASSNLSEDPDGTWSNTKMLRYFVKEAVKERQGTEDELGILNLVSAKLLLEFSTTSGRKSTTIPR
jgi:hypothetical protein